MSFISLDEVLATAQSTIKDADSNDKVIWRQWLGILAIPELGMSEQNIRIVELIPQEFHAAKPNDCRGIIDISLFDSSNCPVAHVWRAGSERIYRNTQPPFRTAIVGPPPDTSAQPIGCIVPVDVSDDSQSIHLGTNADLVAKIILRYFAFEVDETGLPLIDQEDTLALVYFIQFMTAMREKESPSLIASYKINWEKEADRCRARKKSRSISNEVMKTVVSRIWMRLIPRFDFQVY